MAIKKTTYSEIELSWALQQLESWKAYVDANPLETLTDRVQWKSTKTGGTMPMVIASIEQQGKFIQDTMKNYLALLKEVEAMRKIEEEKKISARGSQELTPFEEDEE
jgi:hypothetical protein